MPNKKDELPEFSQSNLFPGGPLDKAFVVFHRMIMVMSEAEPSVKVVLLAYDENDRTTGNAMLVSSKEMSAKDVATLLEQGLNSAIIKRVLGSKVVG